MIELAWHVRAACRVEGETELFYVDEREEPEVIAALRVVCVGCEALSDCRSHSLTWEQYGFWAGMTEIERAEERRRLGITRRPIPGLRID